LGRTQTADRRPQTTDGRPQAADDKQATHDEPGAPEDRERRPSSVVRRPSGLEEHLLGCLLLRPDLLARLDAEMIEQHATPLGEEDFADAENRAALAALQTASLPAESWTADDALALVGTALEDRWRAVLAQAQRHPALADEKLLKDLGDSLLRLRERNLRQQVNQLAFLIRESEEAGEREQLRAYQELMVSYATQKRYVHKLLNARTMAGALAQITKDKPS
jgi:hypothetical protein